MRKMFCTWAVGAILVATLGTRGAAQPKAGEDREQKEKVRIVVVEKTDGSGGGARSQKPRPENRNKKP